MPDILLFGATGYTGRLTAEALARRGASFAIAGRNASKLEALSEATGDPQVRVADVDDVDALVRALEDVKVLVTCVGPFVDLGTTAVEAALRARVHYIDSTGEGTFISKLIADVDGRARDAGIVMAPAMGFDEVPADVAASLSVAGMEQPDLVLTYAFPRSGSRGTIRSALGIAVSEGQWIEEGRPRPIRAGEKRRWAPMPPPLGPKPAMSFPLAEGFLAPLHLELRSLKLFVTTGTAQLAGARIALPALRSLLASQAADPVLERLVSLLPEGPDERARRARWTILAEAAAGRSWRNVALSGSDPYGLTAEFLTAGAMRMAQPDFAGAGVCAPVQAVGLEVLQKELIDQGVSIDVYENRS